MPKLQSNSQSNLNASVIAQGTNSANLLSNSVKQRTQIKTSIPTQHPPLLEFCSHPFFKLWGPEFQGYNVTLLFHYLSFPEIVCELLSLKYYRKMREKDNLLFWLFEEAVSNCPNFWHDTDYISLSQEKTVEEGPKQFLTFFSERFCSKDKA